MEAPNPSKLPWLDKRLFRPCEEKVGKESAEAYKSGRKLELYRNVKSRKVQNGRNDGIFRLF